MCSKKLIIVSLALSLFLGLFGTAFAGEGHYKSLLGTDNFVFDAPLTKQDLTANTYAYDQQKLALVGTERGIDEFKFNAQKTKSELAAINYIYDEEQLALVGTEKGNCQFKFETMGM